MTTKILVDANSYIRAFGGGNGIFEEHVRDGFTKEGYRWEEYEATPEEIKELIDKCVNIKMIEK